MTRFERVVRILDNAVGGPDAPVGFHGSFWRGATRDEFVARKVLGLPLVSIGDSAGSILLKALRGETPFGADSGNPEADFNRMPSGLPPVPTADIDFIAKWIDDGCPEGGDELGSSLSWRKTNAPTASSRTDDLWFTDPLTGWAVNSDGKIMRTTDGGESWVVQFTAPAVYLRCVGFANANVGWVGTLSRARRLFRTTDGGTNWLPVLPLPSLAPVAVCGLSVVNESIVYCSGTNRPTDVPRMMKTVDGGLTWTAWDMSPFASVLIDCYFFDALHGWVVGGKADEPTPTTRNKLKPVVLETTDGGQTWTNHLAGQENDFPLGEWGWKIQFLDSNIGFISLENFRAAAILKTSDGGRTWRRLPVNDPQENVNLEGIGFIDEQTGWVGGWGPGGFGGVGNPQGFSSATTDGGVTWADANDIGLFINRFRFFGSPVSVGYASGDTIYKYSSAPASVRSLASDSVDDQSRSLLPETSILGTAGEIPIRMKIPLGTKRLSLIVWTRFGEEVGCILDEIRPSSGSRVFRWDGIDSRGVAVAPGDYIVRLIADDLTTSRLLKVSEPSERASLAAAAPRVGRARRDAHPLARESRFKSLGELVNAPTHDLDWLRDALQTAVQLELATLPPYLTARWSIRSPSDPVAQTIKQIAREEMFHMGLACNLLTAVGGSPLIADPAVVPKYPGPLPWGIRPGLEVTLRKLDKAQAKVFMEIEYPQHGPVALTGEAPVTIGEFYESLLVAFKTLNPTLSTSRQLEGELDLYVIDSLELVKQAIQTINLQGEGSDKSPEEAAGILAHFYEFGEIYNGKRFVNTNGHWGYTGPDVIVPAVYDMVDVPAGGYQQNDVPDPQVWELIDRFDRAYSDMLRLLQQAWLNGDPGTLSNSVGKMFQMASTARLLLARERPDGQGNYGPCFRYVP